MLAATKAAQVLQNAAIQLTNDGNFRFWFA